MEIEGDGQRAPEGSVPWSARGLGVDKVDDDVPQDALRPRSGRGMNLQAVDDIAEVSPSNRWVYTQPPRRDFFSWRRFTENHCKVSNTSEHAKPQVRGHFPSFAQVTQRALDGTVNPLVVSRVSPPEPAIAS